MIELTLIAAFIFALYQRSRIVELERTLRHISQRRQA